MKYRRMIKKL